MSKDRRGLPMLRTKSALGLVVVPCRQTWHQKAPPACVLPPPPLSDDLPPSLAPHRRRSKDC